jgi:hypothetical protein
MTLSPTLKDHLSFPLNVIAMDMPHLVIGGFGLPGWLGTAGIILAGMLLAVAVIAAGIWWQRRQ